MSAESHEPFFEPLPDLRPVDTLWDSVDLENEVDHPVRFRKIGTAVEVPCRFQKGDRVRSITHEWLHERVLDSQLPPERVTRESVYSLAISSVNIGPTAYEAFAQLLNSSTKSVMSSLSLSKGVRPAR